MQQNVIPINLPVTATFKNTFKDQSNPNGLIPTDSIIDKGYKTGFGLTYSEFRAQRHSLIVIPYTPTIDDKIFEHEEMRPLAVYGENTVKKFQEIKDYLLNDNIEYKKIAVTPESFWKVIATAREIGKEQWLYDEFFCFLDESHCYACDAFRENILTPFTYFWKFKKRALGSATPYPFSDPRFNTLTYYKLRFTESLGTVKIIHEDEPLAVLRYLLTHPELFPGRVHIFFGSVTATGKVVKEIGLTDVRIFCRDEEDNMKNLGEAEKYFRDSIQGADFAKFNFYTGRYNEGCDLRDDATATMILVTDVNIQHTLVGIDYRGVQALGRLRLKVAEQPYQMIHITNTKEAMKTDRNKIEENVIYSAKQHIEHYNTFNQRRFTEGMQDILDMGNFIERVGDLGNGKATLNHHKIDQIVYAKALPLQYDNIETVHEVWQSCNRKTETAKFGLSKIKQSRRSDEAINRDVMAEFKKFNENPDLYQFGKAERDIQRLKDKHSVLYQTYMIFGPEEVERLTYNNDKMKAALVDRSNKNHEAQLRKMIAERIKIGEYTKKEIKNILQIIYDTLEIKKLDGKRKVAKAEDLKDLGMFQIDLFKGESDKGTRIDKFRIVRELYKIKQAA